MEEKAQVADPKPSPGQASSPRANLDDAAYTPRAGDKGNDGGARQEQQRIVRPPKGQRAEASSGLAASSWQPVCWSYCSITMLVVFVALIILFAIAPALIVFAVLRWLKRDNVSWPLIMEMFWLGLVGAIPIAFIEAGIAWLTIEHWKDNRNLGVLFAVATLNAFIIAALCEELFKYMCVTRVVPDRRLENCWLRHPDKAYGTILCGCAAALGFATIENVLYVKADLAVETAALRAILAVPGHCAGGVITAIGICEREFYSKDTNIFFIVTPSVIFHGFYDWFLMASAIGYMDGKGTGDALALAGLICAMLTDVAQFLYMFHRLNGLDEQEAGYVQVASDEVYE